MSSADSTASAAINAGSLVLEPLVATHAAELYPLLADRELYRYLDHGPPASQQQLEDTYRRLEARVSADGREWWLNWAVRDMSLGVVGYVQATVPTVGRSAWIAYVLGRSFQGQGRARRAVTAMCGHLAQAHRKTLFKACVEVSNRPSIRLLEHLGFEAAAPQTTEAAGLAPTERLYLLRHAGT
jgi:[ribosomal protein S5]-alanine N-acetyltransferase